MTLFCGGFHYDQAAGKTVADFNVSHDGGLHWVKKKASGVQTSLVPPGSVVASPLFAEDHRVYWGTSQGLLYSDDEGESWTVADAQASFVGGKRPALIAVPNRFTGLPVSPPGPLPVLDDPVVGMLIPGASATTSSLFVDPAERPIAASPVFDDAFLLGPSNMVLDLGWEGSDPADQASPRHLVLYGCDSSYACTDRRAAFAMPAANETTYPFYQWSSGPEGNLVLGFVAVDGHHRYSAWRSLDAGRTVQSWPSLNRIISAFDPRGTGNPSLVLSSPSGGKHNVMWLRLSDQTRDQVWFSTDTGAHWSRIAHAEEATPRQRGNLPWTAGVQGQVEMSILTVGSRLFTAAVKGGMPTLYYSTDSGKTWRVAAA